MGGGTNICTHAKKIFKNEKPVLLGAAAAICYKPTKVQTIRGSFEVDFGHPTHKEEARM